MGRAAERRREARQVKKNYTKGKASENKVAAQYRRNGYTVTHIRDGADLKATKPGHATKYIEVKSGPGEHGLTGVTDNHELRPNQQAMKRRHGSNYVIVRDY